MRIWISANELGGRYQTLQQNIERAMKNISKMQRDDTKVIHGSIMLFGVLTLLSLPLMIPFAVPLLRLAFNSHITALASGIIMIGIATLLILAIAWPCKKWGVPLVDRLTKFDEKKQQRILELKDTLERPGERAYYIAVYQFSPFYYGNEEVLDFIRPLDPIFADQLQKELEEAQKFVAGAMTASRQMLCEHFNLN